MKEYFVLEIQNNADGTCGFLETDYEDKGASEDAYLAKRTAARQSNVPSHTVVWMDKLGNVIEKKNYVHEQTNPQTPQENPQVGE